MSLAWIRSHYDVPARRGMRVLFRGQPGWITGAGGGHLVLRMFAEPQRKVRTHPMWMVEYLDGPARFQLRRVKGWRKPSGAINVARPTKWGNPHTPCKWRWEAFGEVSEREVTVQDAVDAFRRDLLAGDLKVSVADVRRELAGRDLACWCPPDQPCHADVLLALANGGDGRV